MIINNIKDDGDKKYSTFNENNEKDNEYSNGNNNKKNSKDNSSIKIHENVYKNMNDIDQDKKLLKQGEQEYQPDCDKQSDLTQTTLDKIISYQNSLNNQYMIYLIVF